MRHSERRRLVVATRILPALHSTHRNLEPKPVREFVRLAEGEGLRPTSVEQGRGVLLRYNRFLEERYGKDVDRAGWKEFAAYKVYLGGRGVQKSTISGYLAYISTYFRLKAEATQSAKAFDSYVRTRLIGRIWRKHSEPWKPFSPETLNRILRASRRSHRKGGRYVEDHVFITAMLYTGGRAQLYGLRVGDVDFKRMEVSVPRKGGTTVSVPLHPHLAEVLRKHFRERRYDSAFVFRCGRDSETLLGQRSNRQHPWRVCKRVQQEAGLTESVHPHRFRKTVAAEGRPLGLDPQFVQAILGHRYIGMTLDLYTTVDMDELKREFSKLDFSAKFRRSPHPDDEDRLSALLAIAPKGKESEWALLVRGLLTLLGLTSSGVALTDRDLSSPPRRSPSLDLRLALEKGKLPPALASNNRNDSLSLYAAHSKLKSR